MSYSLIYLSKLKEFIASKKKGGSRLWEKIGLLWGVSLPIIFGVVALILPVKLLCFWINSKEILKSLTAIYFYLFVPSFFVFSFILFKFDLE